MGMWPVRASSTWSGVRIIRGGRTDIVPWLLVLSQMTRQPDRSIINLNFASQRDYRLAVLHRGRAVRTALRAGIPVRWTSAASASWLPEFAVPSLLTLTLSGFIFTFLWRRPAVFVRDDALPLGVYLVTILFFGLMLLASTVGAAMLLRLFWTAARSEVLSAELAGDRLTITDRSGTRTIRREEVRSIHRGIVMTLTLQSGERIAPRSLPAPILEAWLGATPFPAHMERAERASFRRLAIGAPIVGLALGLLGAWLDAARFATSTDAALFVAGMTFFLSLIGGTPWLLTRRSKRRPTLS